MDNILQKHQYFVLLYDLYGGLLTVKQQNIFDLYYQNDYSIGEIAEELEISKQAVYDALKRSESILEDYENKLALAAKELSRKNIVRQMKEKLNLISDDKFKTEIINLLDELDLHEGE